MQIADLSAFFCLPKNKAIHCGKVRQIICYLWITCYNLGCKQVSTPISRVLIADEKL